MCRRHGPARPVQALRPGVSQRQAGQAGHVRRDDQDPGHPVGRPVSLSPRSGAPPHKGGFYFALTFKPV